MVADLHAAVAIPSPGLGDERVAAAGVAKAVLQLGAHVAGNQVGGGGRVAVVQDGDHAALLTLSRIRLLQLPQGREKWVQAVGVILKNG